MHFPRIGYVLKKAAALKHGAWAGPALHRTSNNKLKEIKT